MRQGCATPESRRLLESRWWAQVGHETKFEEFRTKNKNHNAELEVLVLKHTDMQREQHGGTDESHTIHVTQPHQKGRGTGGADSLTANL